MKKSSFCCFKRIVNVINNSIEKNLRKKNPNRLFFNKNINGLFSSGGNPTHLNLKSRFVV